VLEVQKDQKKFDGWWEASNAGSRCYACGRHIRFLDLYVRGDVMQKMMGTGTADHLSGPKWRVLRCGGGWIDLVCLGERRSRRLSWQTQREVQGPVAAEAGILRALRGCGRATCVVKSIWITSLHLFPNLSLIDLRPLVRNHRIFTRPPPLRCGRS
jgi:hypothetical protein